MAVPQDTALARRLKAARALSGKKLAQVAREVGIHERTLQRLERGDRPPTVPELEAIAEATGQSIEFFFGASLAAVEGERGTVSRRREVVKS